jgi:hypothetical protein
MKTTFWLLLCVLIYLGMTAWISFSLPHEPTPNANQSQQKAEPAKEKNASLGAALTDGFIRQGQFIHDFKDEVVAVGTVFIAAFTIILAFATGFLYAATRDLVRDAKETSNRQLRAYVSGTVVHISSFDKDELVTFKFKVENSGQTPARVVVHHAEVIVAPEPLPETYVFPDITTTLSNPANVFPGKSFEGTITSIRPFTLEERTKIIDGSARIYCCGEIFYEDVFGKDDCRTRFCASLVADAETIRKLADGYRKTDLKVNFHIARTGNSDT